MLNYNSAINGETFSFVNLDKHPDWNLTRKELLSKFPMFIDFMKVHRCSLDELCDITYKLGICDKNLFEYVTYNHYNSVLVARNAVYRTITERIGFNTRSVKKYSDVFIWQNTYAELRLADVAAELIKKRFPFLLTPTFMKREKRFKDSINNLLLNEKTKVNDLDSLITLENNLTVADLVKLYTDPGYKDSYIEAPLWHIYSDYKQIFIDCDSIYSDSAICVPISALYDKNWGAVENVDVYSVSLYDANGEIIKGKWYNGKQKGAPYMESEVAKALKEYFKC